MIYVFANDDRGLSVYATQGEAVAACEGIDVKDGNYAFFSSDGCPLHARFTRTDRHDYTLESLGQTASPGLREILARVAYVEGCGLTNVQMVEAKIAGAEYASYSNGHRGSAPGTSRD